MTTPVSWAAPAMTALPFGYQTCPTRGTHSANKAMTSCSATPATTISWAVLAMMSCRLSRAMTACGETVAMMNFTAVWGHDELF